MDHQRQEERMHLQEQFDDSSSKARIACEQIQEVSIQTALSKQTHNEDVVGTMNILLAILNLR